MKSYSLEHVSRPRRAEFEQRLRELEAAAEYPLGTDSFRIDHGRDYFAFYDRLGEVSYYAATEHGRVIAVGCGVLRSVPDAQGAAQRVYYLADLKVTPEARGRRIPLSMLARTFPRHYWRCPRGYAVSMNPPAGENRVVRLLKRFRWATIEVATTMALYSLDAEAMRLALPIVEAHRGRTGFLDLRSTKDLVLKSTGRSLPLLHAQFGPLAKRSLLSPVEGATHMFMTPEGDALDGALRRARLAASARASVLAHRMSDFDFTFLLTSDV